MLAKSPDFEFTSMQPITQTFREMEISTFDGALSYTKNLPYKRNTNKSNLSTVFSDGCGTCSSKHALLQQLALENNFNELRLMVGLFQMNALNTPAIQKTLLKYKLTYIPEAHCYLKWKNSILDCTKAHSKPEDFIHDLITEIEIRPNQITEFKVHYHQEFLRNWLNQHPEISYTLEELWRIREQCIEDLGT